MMRPFLSICIPTYNRLEIIKNNLEHLLVYDGQDIEIVVVDDSSTDGTLEYLQSITDPRFRYVCNKPNLGGAKNFIAAIFNGAGKYVLYCNDRDLVLPEQLPRLIQMLHEDEYSYIMTCNDSVKRSGRIVTYEKGYESLRAIPIESHNTGNIYNGDLIREHLVLEDFYPYADTTFGEKFVSRALGTMGQIASFDYATYRNGGSMVKQEELVSGHVSNGLVKTDEDFYFHPKQSWHMVQAVWSQVFEHRLLDLTSEQTNDYIQYLMDFMVGRIPDYRLYRNMEGYRIHYNLSNHKVSVGEAIALGREYMSIMKAFLKERAPHMAFQTFCRRIPKHWLFIYKSLAIQKINELRGN